MTTVADPPSVLLLLSGGIDSPVAGQLLERQGAAVDTIHFSQEPFTDDGPERKARAQAETLGWDPPTVAPAGPALATLARECPHDLYFVLQKRFMLRVASRVADDRGLEVLATGENLGQVSSQTLQNLATVDAAATRPVLRPLLGWNKQDVVDRARTIGTLETAKGPEMCDQLGPDHPSTAAPVHEAEAAEKAVDVESLVDDVLDGLQEPVPA